MDIVSVLELCLSATFTCFRVVFYQQCFGTLIGSPVSVTVANLVMEEFEELDFPLFHQLYDFGRGVMMTPACCYHQTPLATSGQHYPSHSVHSGEGEEWISTFPGCFPLL